LKILSIIAFTLISSAFADKIVVETIGCPELKTIQGAAQYTDDIMALNQYAIANGCVFLNSANPIEAVDYDPASEKSIYIKVLDKRTGSLLYVKRQFVDIERSGRKNNFRF
jgi:hypothetical protein